jgi:hypothetical protein
MNQVKALIKNNIPNVEEKIRNMATSLGFSDIESISQEEAQLIADKVQKANPGLVTEPAPATVPVKITHEVNGNGNGNGNGKKANITQETGINMKKVITDLGQTVSSLEKTNDSLCTELTSKTVDSISERLLQVKPDILKDVAARVNKELGDIDTFCSEFERMFRESIPNI